MGGGEKARLTLANWDQSTGGKKRRCVEKGVAQRARRNGKGGGGGGLTGLLA